MHPILIIFVVLSAYHLTETSVNAMQLAEKDQQQFYLRATVKPVTNFIASDDAAIIRKAMREFGTDEDAMIEVLCRRTNDERMEIVRKFKTAYGKDLLKEIKAECSLDFSRVLIALCTPIYEFYARELHRAMHGDLPHSNVLIEVLSSLSNRDIFHINVVYGQIFGKNLEATLKERTFGSFKRTVVSLSTGNREESMIPDVNTARVDAQVLVDAGIRQTGTDESEFNRILSLRSYEQIKLIAQEYEKLTNNTLEKDIKKEFSGDAKDVLLGIVRCALNRPEFFAKRLNAAMAGFGTNDQDLIRLIVTRSEIDMLDIKEAYQKKYGKSLKSDIRDDTSGDYKHALYALIGEERSRSS